MRKALIVTGLAAAALFGGVACSGTASADESDQTVVVNQSNSQTSGSADCAPASLLAAFPWLPVPACS
jgi:hypothetical protein